MSSPNRVVDWLRRTVGRRSSRHRPTRDLFVVSFRPVGHSQSQPSRLVENRRSGLVEEYHRLR